MKTKDFIAQVRKLGYQVNNGVENEVMIMSGTHLRARIYCYGLCLNTFDLLLVKLCVEYAETPLDLRDDQKRYIVALPDPLRRGKHILALGRLQEHEDEVIIQRVRKETLQHERCKLTEEEIKRNHKYLWGFAEEVDE